MTCFDRINETKELWRLIKEDKNLLMLAPRRIGKTVILNHLRETAEGQGFRAIVLDVEGFREEKGFFRQCCSAIQEEISTGAKVLTAFTSRLSRALKGGAEDGDWRKWLLRTDWQDFADHLLAHLDQHGEEPPWLILVDELPVFVQALQKKNGDGAIGAFLYWLRNMRQKHRNVRWLYAGSIGLDSLSRRYSVEGSLNDLDPFTLGPFSPETAAAFLDDIAARRERVFSSGATSSLLERLGWLSPYYLEKIAEDACARSERNGTIEVGTVQASMDRMLDLEKRTYWSTWREHLDRNFPEPERSRLYTVLEAVARSKEGAGRDVLLGSLNRSGETVNERDLRGLLDTLQADGYLQPDGTGLYRFRMNLLREWWLRYVVF